MQLTEKHTIKPTDYRFQEIDALAFKSKNLYNAANYTIRQSYAYGWGYITYNQMDKLMKYHEAYKALPAKVSQQVLMLVDRNWKSFFEAMKSYNSDPSKFKGRPRLPGYKDKAKGRNLLVYTMQAISTKLLIGLLMFFQPFAYKPGVYQKRIVIIYFIINVVKILI